MRRALAVGLLSAASVVFLFRFDHLETGRVHVDDPAVAAPTTTSTTVPPTTTTSIPHGASVAAADVATFWGRYRVEVTTVENRVVDVEAKRFVTGERLVSGPAVQTGWGKVRVEIAVVDGRVDWITMMQIPADTQRSRVVSREVEPVLREEALATQSADLHVVAGATMFCTGYMRSLRGALEAAGL
jgi:hypothetical protein